MSKDFNKKLRKARPRLSLIAPLTHKIVIGFVLFNSWIGWTIFVQPNLQLPIVGGFINATFWAITYLILAGWLLIALIMNDWKGIRQAMVIGLFIKSVWAYALFVVGFRYGFSSVQGVIGLWLFAVYVQLVTVLYFTPNGRSHG